MNSAYARISIIALVLVVLTLPLVIALTVRAALDCDAARSTKSAIELPRTSSADRLRVLGCRMEIGRGTSPCRPASTVGLSSVTSS